MKRRRLTLAIGLAALIAAAWAFKRGRVTVQRAVVTGESMVPAFRPGDRVLVVGPWPARPGQVVAISDPRLPARSMASRLMVKRVHSVEGGAVDARGDNPHASTDSRHFGPVPRSHLAGRVVYRYWPAERSGWLP